MAHANRLLLIPACGAFIWFAPCTTFAQQATVQYTWTWSEVVAHSNTPSTATPGVIDPTEGVRLTLHALMTPDIGEPVTYIGGPGPGVGTLYAWGGNLTQLVGSAVAHGSFSLAAATSGFYVSAIDPPTGNATTFSVLSNWTIGQPASFANPIESLFSVTWTPTSHEPRSVSFFSRDPITAQGANSALVQYIGSAGNPLVTPALALATHGPGTGAIPIVPAPAGLTLLAAAAFAGRRRRAKQHGNTCST